MSRERFIESSGVKFERIPIKTKILSKDDDMLEIVKEFAMPFLRKDDVISISESPLAITQGRAIPVDGLKIGLTAGILWRFVSKVSYGIGLRAPESMQCAVDEVGVCRIWVAAILGSITRFLGRKGDFYRIAGMQAALIDAASTSPIPPYDKTVIKGPKNPKENAQKIKDALGYETGIMDINDIGGCWMIGGSDGLNKHFMEAVMKDNPQGQGDELTPICIIRRV